MPREHIEVLYGVGDPAGPGYKWVPGCYGPHPGIPKAQKIKLDKLNSKEYLEAFLKLSQEEKESLMVSEAERRRTYTAQWPIETIVKANDCAKEGFYYTGVADRVRCAFCGGIVRNWERGEVPKSKHKDFDHCHIVRGGSSNNISVDQEFALPENLVSDQISLRDSGSKPTTLGDLNINTVKPKHPALSVFSKRKETYRRYPDSNPISADRLCEAGFFYEGISDKVRCFWCDGTLKRWRSEDDPWTEHAKWFPGCPFLHQTKSRDFVRDVRSAMTADDLRQAETLSYNSGDLSFLDDVTLDVPGPGVAPYVDYWDREGYKYCHSLGVDEKFIAEAYMANKGEEFEDRDVLLRIAQELQNGNTGALETYRQKSAENINPAHVDATTATQSERVINVSELVTSPDDPTAEESQDLVTSFRCKKCRMNMAGAVVLPCGCLCLCQDCSRGNLPLKCPACSRPVRGVCRTLMEA